MSWFLRNVGIPLISGLALTTATNVSGQNNNSPYCPSELEAKVMKAFDRRLNTERSHGTSAVPCSGSLDQDQKVDKDGDTLTLTKQGYHFEREGTTYCLEAAVRRPGDDKVTLTLQEECSTTSEGLMPPRGNGKTLKKVTLNGRRNWEKKLGKIMAKLAKMGISTN